jgi:hypothetical protein
VELLIVIAIIAILVVIAIVAINPIERIRDTNDERANAAVRQAATAIQACVTKELAQNASADIEAECGTWAVLTTGGYVSGTVPNALNGTNGDFEVSAGGVGVCAWSTGGHDGADADTNPDNAFFTSTQSEIDAVDDTGSTNGSATACP